MVLLSAFAIHCSVFCDRNFYGRSGVCLALHITPEKPSGWEYSVFVFLCKLIFSLNILRQGRKEKVKFCLTLNMCHKDMSPLSEKKSLTDIVAKSVAHRRLFFIM